MQMLEFFPDAYIAGIRKAKELRRERRYTEAADLLYSVVDVINRYFETGYCRNFNDYSHAAMNPGVFRECTEGCEYCLCGAMDDLTTEIWPFINSSVINKTRSYQVKMRDIKTLNQVSSARDEIKTLIEKGNVKGAFMILHSIEGILSFYEGCVPGYIQSISDEIREFVHENTIYKNTLTTQE